MAAFATALLAVAALYSGIEWLRLSVIQIRGRAADPDAVERYTFHLGLCFIIAVGFLGLIAKG